MAKLVLCWSGANASAAKILPNGLVGRLEGIDFSGLNMSDNINWGDSKFDPDLVGLDATSAEFYRCTFTQADVRGMRVSFRTKFVECLGLDTAVGGADLLERLERAVNAEQVRKRMADQDSWLPGYAKSRPPTLREMAEAEAAAREAEQKK